MAIDGNGSSSVASRRMMLSESVIRREAQKIRDFPKKIPSRDVTAPYQRFCTVRRSGKRMECSRAGHRNVRVILAALAVASRRVVMKKKGWSWYSPCHGPEMDKRAASLWQFIITSRREKHTLQ